MSKRSSACPRAPGFPGRTSPASCAPCVAIRPGRKARKSSSLPGEILADEKLDTAIDADNPDADTKVSTAVSWLERARSLERNENHTRVFPGSLKVPSMEDAEKRLAQGKLSEEMPAQVPEPGFAAD